MVTKEWVAIHRKHHAKCETEDDPHSPQTRGIKAVLLTGSEMYRTEAKNQETIAKFGHGTPDDWIERNLYAASSWQGVGLMMIINLFLFGAIGATIWAVQMVWIPITAAGIINGIGHWWGYRNFEAPDACRNIVPWGIVIGGEELHNNHHTYPTSAKLSVKPYEFDIGWMYIRGLEIARPGQGSQDGAADEARRRCAPVADGKTLEAIIANRYEVMAKYARSLRHASGAEIARLKREGAASTAALANLRIARRWLHRDDEKIPHEVKAPGGRGRGREPVPRQAGRDARGAAAPLDAHRRLGRAAGRRSAGLAAQGRRERHRRPAGIRAASARRPRVIGRFAEFQRGCCATLSRSAKYKRGRIATPFCSDPDRFAIPLSRHFNFVSL